MDCSVNTSQVRNMNLTSLERSGTFHLIPNALYCCVNLNYIAVGAPFLFPLQMKEAAHLDFVYYIQRGLQMQAAVPATNIFILCGLMLVILSFKHNYRMSKSIRLEAL